MTPREKLAEIVAGLEGVTQGPWAVDGYSTDAVIYMPAGENHVSQWKHLAKCGTAEGRWRHNAAHIARLSPEAILSIAEYVRDLERDRDDWKNSSDEDARAADELAARATAAEATVTALQEAIEPFASAAAAFDPPENDDDFLTWGTKFTIGDLRRARTALSQVRSEK